MTTEINFSERGFLAPHGLEDYRDLTRDMTCFIDVIHNESAAVLKA